MNLYMIRHKKTREPIKTAYHKRFSLYRTEGIARMALSSMSLRSKKKEEYEIVEVEIVQKT